MENNLERIADYYGYEKQSRKTVEELAELTVAINKYIDEPKESHFLNLIEEIADVEIMLEQLKIIHDIDIEFINDIKLNKIKRQINRITREENGIKVKNKKLNEIAAKEIEKTYKECTFTEFLLEEDQDEEELQRYMREQEKQEVVNIFINFLEGYYGK